jgi:hypothetical protein
MNTLMVEYPESLPDSARLSRKEFESTMRFALASKLFELGRLPGAHRPLHLSQISPSGGCFSLGLGQR